MRISRKWVMYVFLTLAFATAPGQAQGPAEMPRSQKSRAANVIDGVGQPTGEFDSTLPETMRDQHPALGLPWPHPLLPDAPTPPSSTIERVWRACCELAESLRQWLIGERNYWWVLATILLVGLLVKKWRK